MSTASKMIILFLAVFALTGGIIGYNVFFRNKVSAEPERLFHEALIHNLDEKGITCTVNQSKSGTRQNLAVQLDLASKTNARSLLTVTTEGTTVQTEEIVVKSGDYLRYTKVQTDVKNAQGGKPDYSKILNKWIKTEGTKPPELFELTSLGGCVVPLAKLPTLSLSSLSRAINNDSVFVTEYNRSEVAEQDGRKVRNYDVAIQPVPYVTLMREVGKAAGLKILDSLKTDDFTDKQARMAIFSVDTKTGRLARIQFTDETRTVTFTGYGEVPKLKAPTETISNKEASKLIAR